MDYEHAGPDQDLLARYGGEEFVVLLPQSDDQETFIVAERIREAVATVPLTTAHGAISATVSLAIATLVDDRDDLTQLIHRADQALYQAKAAGRNCSIEVPVQDGWAHQVVSMVLHTTLPRPRLHPPRPRRLVANVAMLLRIAQMYGHASRAYTNSERGLSFLVLMCAVCPLAHPLLRARVLDDASATKGENLFPCRIHSVTLHPAPMRYPPP